MKNKILLLMFLGFFLLIGVLGRVSAEKKGNFKITKVEDINIEFININEEGGKYLGNKILN